MESSAKAVVGVPAVFGHLHGQSRTGKAATHRQPRTKLACPYCHKEYKSQQTLDKHTPRYHRITSGSVIQKQKGNVLHSHRASSHPHEQSRQDDKSDQTLQSILRAQPAHESQVTFPADRVRRTVDGTLPYSLYDISRQGTVLVDAFNTKVSLLRHDTRNWRANATSLWFSWFSHGVRQRLRPTSINDSLRRYMLQIEGSKISVLRAARRYYPPGMQSVLGGGAGPFEDSKTLISKAAKGHCYPGTRSTHEGDNNTHDRLLKREEGLQGPDHRPQRLSQRLTSLHTTRNQVFPVSGLSRVPLQNRRSSPGYPPPSSSSSTCCSSSDSSDSDSDNGSRPSQNHEPDECLDNYASTWSSHSIQNHAADTALNDSTNDWLAASDYDYQHDGHLEQPSTFSFNDNPRAGREGTLHFYQDDNAYYEEDMQGQQGAQDGYTSGYDDQHASHYDHHNFDSHLHQSPSFGFEADYQAGWEKILNLDEGDNVCYEGNMESQQGCFQDEYVSGYDDHHGGNCSDNAYYDDGSYDDGSYDDGSYDDGSYDDGSYDDGYFSDGY